MFDCIVVGAGVLGSSTAYQLIGEGHTVLLLDQFALPHSRGSSHGAVRFIQYPYSDIRHNEAMPEQHQMWHQLEKETSTSLIHKSPFVLLAPSRNAVFTNKVNVLKSSGAVITEPTKGQLEKKFPMLSVPGSPAFFQTEIGIIDAHKSVQSMQNQFVNKGGILRDNEKVLRIEPGAVVAVHTSKGQRYTARGLVITPGPWATSLLQPLGIHLPLKVWRVNVCYFKEKVPGSHRHLPSLFKHVDDGAEKLLVAFPSREYPGMVKVNYHLLWDSVDPDRRDRTVSVRQPDIEGMKEFVKMHLPGLEEEPAVIEPCLYTCSPKEELIVGTHPLHDNIAIGCSMSGKGFKMAPLLGKVLGEMALGKPRSFDTSVISINRFLPNPRISSKL